MSLTLTAATVDAFAETTRILLSPLQFMSASDWRQAAHEATRTLFAADQAMTIMSGAGELVESQDFDPAVLRSLRQWFDGFTDEGRLTLNDPVVNDWNDRRRELGLRIYSRDLIDHAIGGRVLQSPYVNEALFTNGMRFWQGVYASGPHGSDAILWASYSRRDTEPFGEQALPLLSLLAPAFQAGVDVLRSVAASGAALDALAQPMLVFNELGRELYRSTDFRALANRDPGHAAIVARARCLALDIARATGHARRAERAPSSAIVELATMQGRYVLRATLLAERLFCPGPAFAVLVTPRMSVTMPDVRMLQTRHGLTRREAEVALLLAEGNTRDQIARALHISPYTARAHTEQVFLKLGVRARSAVALAIIGRMSDAPAR